MTEFIMISYLSLRVQRIAHKKLNCTCSLQYGLIGSEGVESEG